MLYNCNKSFFKLCNIITSQQPHLARAIIKYVIPYGQSVEYIQNASSYTLNSWMTFGPLGKTEIIMFVNDSASFRTYYSEYKQSNPEGSSWICTFYIVLS